MHLRAAIPFGLAALAAASYTMIVGTEELSPPLFALGTAVLLPPYLIAAALLWGAARLLRAARRPAA